MESANVKVDEYVERNEVEWKKELEDYKTFIYVNEGVPYTFPEKENKATKQQKFVNVELQQQAIEQQMVGAKWCWYTRWGF